MQEEPEVQASSGLVDKREIAKRYSVSNRTIDNWMRTHTIPYTKTSARLVRFDPTECDQALQAFRRSARLPIGSKG